MAGPCGPAILVRTAADVDRPSASKAAPPVETSVLPELGTEHAKSVEAAVEYAADGILVNAIAPGVIETPILGDIPDEMRAVYADAHLIKRLGRPEEVAELFCFLVHPNSSMITGQTYRIDGGASIA
jgi:hypothetical protein